ncbi:hypothetical protein V6N12_014838 [Hibiscus sabdariffa]|uniref:Uncharacterized protein n=1 Tax=Hibiscus sabdariffa TaxID=183260 RepID=A0ABR2DLE2_9ROSI
MTKISCLYLSLPTMVETENHWLQNLRSYLLWCLLRIEFPLDVWCKGFPFVRECRNPETLSASLIQLFLTVL